MAPVERMESSAWCLFACLPNPCSASTTILLPPRRRRRTDGVSRRRCARICSRRLVVEVSRAATESDPDACHPAAVARVTLVTGGATESMRRAATASQGLWSLGAWWWRAPSRRGEAAPRGERAHGACARGVWEQARDRISAAA